VQSLLCTYTLPCRYFLIADFKETHVCTVSRQTLTDVPLNEAKGGQNICNECRGMLLSRHQNGGQNRDIKIANRCSENVAQLKYLGMTVTDQNLIHDEITGTLNSYNACYYSVQNLFSSRPLSKNIKNIIYKTKILLLVLHECETWSLA
jgi:hypothetical protein